MMYTLNLRIPTLLREEHRILLFRHICPIRSLGCSDCEQAPPRNFHLASSRDNARKIVYGARPAAAAQCTNFREHIDAQGMRGI